MAYVSIGMALYDPGFVEEDRLDPVEVSAVDLAAAYAQRWEIELAFPGAFPLTNTYARLRGSSGALRRSRPTGPLA